MKFEAVTLVNSNNKKVLKEKEEKKLKNRINSCSFFKIKQEDQKNLFEHLIKKMYNLNKKKRRKNEEKIF